jgi:cell division protease FtsH
MAGVRRPLRQNLGICLVSNAVKDGDLMENVGWLLAGIVLGVAFLRLASTKWLLAGLSFMGWKQSSSTVAGLIQEHLKPLQFEEISITERRFPFRMRADLQRIIDGLFDGEIRSHKFVGIRKEYSMGAISFSDCIVDSDSNPAVPVPAEYEELNIGEDTPCRVLKNGLWLLEKDGKRFAVMLSPFGIYGQISGMQIQFGAANTLQGNALAQGFFSILEQAVSQAQSYRGKILSLEQSAHSYTGESAGIAVHKLRNVERDQVILPEATLTLLERNVINFVRNRSKLKQLGMSTKKGILFYGPPGTGKTHTIHYLSRALEGHTTLLVSAEQVGLLGEYMTLARLLQPSIVVMEDVDLIARDRANMNSPCEEVLLNKLLNEMDGLKEDADILFILTTNRPEALEAALASRPGRVDQAIEFPVPDEMGRRKLIMLYAPKIGLASDDIEDLVRRTEGVSAAFIKELMRRTSQFAIERSGQDPTIERADIDSALNEMLFLGGNLNLSILGANSSACTG